jgi:hypothetical protein
VGVGCLLGEGCRCVGRVDTERVQQRGDEPQHRTDRGSDGADARERPDGVHRRVFGSLDDATLNARIAVVPAPRVRQSLVRLRLCFISTMA